MAIFDVSDIRNDIQINISLTAIEPDEEWNGSFGRLEYKAQAGPEASYIIFYFDADNDKLLTSIDIAPALNISCLILCGIALVGPILDCYKKNKGNWQGFKDCLEAQGHTLGTSALVCIAACK